MNTLSPQLDALNVLSYTWLFTFKNYGLLYLVLTLNASFAFFFINSEKRYCKTRRQQYVEQESFDVKFRPKLLQRKVRRQLAARSPEGFAATSATKTSSDNRPYTHHHRRPLFLRPPSPAVPVSPSPVSPLSLPHGSRNLPPPLLPRLPSSPRSVTVPRSYYVTIKSNRFLEDDIVLRLSRQIPGSRLIPEVTQRGRIRDTCRVTEE